MPLEEVFTEGSHMTLALIKPQFHNTGKNKKPLISPFWKPVKTKETPKEWSARICLGI